MNGCDVCGAEPAWDYRVVIHDPDERRNDTIERRLCDEDLDKLDRDELVLEVRPA